MKNVLFYKYLELDNLEVLEGELLLKAKSIGLLGKILIAHEGINGCFSGDDDAVEEYMNFLTSDNKLGDIEFKISHTDKHSFKKMFVRIRNEIIAFNQDVSLKNKAPYIEPEELKTLLEQEAVILIDARNKYESRVGRFKGAITPNMDVFTGWPEVVNNLKPFKDKLIVTYCTGGIRCEKASAYMVEQGFTNVKQLHGGIIGYGNEVGDKHWEGKCFVFDKRGVVDIDPEKQTLDISNCRQCSLPCSNHHNCDRADCDEFVILCENCIELLESCCSKRCRNIVRFHPEERCSIGS